MASLAFEKSGRRLNSTLLLLCCLLIFGIYLGRKSTEVGIGGSFLTESVKSVTLTDYFLFAKVRYSESCGGCSVLHLLAHLMNKAQSHGGDPIAYLTDADGPCSTNPGYMTPLLPTYLNASNSIAVYNENPTNSFNVMNKIYYVLFFPGNGVMYPEGSYILCWSVGFCKGVDTSMKKFTLNLLQIDMRLFDSIKRSVKREKSYILLKKKVWMLSGKVVTLEDDVDFSLGDTFPIQESKLNRLDLLAQTKRLVSYDRATFISVEAAAMGCLSVVMPLPNVTRDEWLESVGDAFKYGIAYGFEEIDYALSTMDRVNDHLRLLASKQEGNVREFVQDARNFFGV
jgi:hypothetical protein